MIDQKRTNHPTEPKQNFDKRTRSTKAERKHLPHLTENKANRGRTLQPEENETENPKPNDKREKNTTTQHTQKLTTTKNPENHLIEQRFNPLQQQA